MGPINPSCAWCHTDGWDGQYKRASDQEVRRYSSTSVIGTCIGRPKARPEEESSAKPYIEVDPAGSIPTPGDILKKLKMKRVDDDSGGHGGTLVPTDR